MHPPSNHFKPLKPGYSVMVSTILKFPFYAKASLLLVGLYVFVSILYIAQDIILPLIYATILAVSISPAVDFLVKKKINRPLSIIAVLSTAVLLVAVLIAFISSQASRLIDAWPQLTDKYQELLKQTVGWASGFLDISTQKINAWLTNVRSGILNNSSSVIGSTLTTVGGVLATALLTPVYIFMILFYQPHLVKSTHDIFGSYEDHEVNDMMNETKTIIQSYLVGLFLEFVIIAILNSVGLLILGIEYAILLGIIGALLNIVPYLGGMVAVFLYMIIALVTKEPVYALYVVGLYTIIQLIDNNYIVPKIVGSKVKLNAFFSLIAVIAGAALWGIPGMFLSIPITAIIKLILDRTESLKPWGYLLGDTTPPLLKIKPRKVKSTSL